MPRKSTGKRLRFDVFERDSYTCRYCGAQPPAVVLVVDHVVPVAADGETTADNLVTACEPCNQGKSDRILGAVSPAPDTDLLYLKTQQEIGEMRRYHRSLEAREAQQDQVIAALQSVWVKLTGLDWMPSASTLARVLGRYSPEVAERAVRETAQRVGGDFFKRDGDWVRYLWGVARNTDEVQPAGAPEKSWVDGLTDEQVEMLNWTWTELIGDDAYMECVRAVRREMPRPEPDPDDPHSDADWEPYTALLGFRRMGEAILARAEEVRQEWYEPEEEAIDDVGQN